MNESFMLKVEYNRFILPHKRWGVIMIKENQWFAREKWILTFSWLYTLVIMGKYISSEKLMGPIFWALLLLSPSDS